MPSSQSTGSVSDLESKLAGFVHSYIAAFHRGDPSQQQEELRWVCSGLEFLLGVLLQERDGWAGWVDGINPTTDMLPDSISVVSAVELSVRGWAIWGESAGAGPFWIEPLLGSVRISDTGDAIVSYELSFGNAALAGSRLYGLRRARSLANSRFQRRIPHNAVRHRRPEDRRVRGRRQGPDETYLGWLKRYACEPDEAEPLGMILCPGRSEEHIALLQLQKSGIHVASYWTDVPPKKGTGA